MESEYDSKFLQHIVDFSIANLTAFEIEMLCITGYDTAFMCLDLDESLQQFETYVKENWNDLRYKPEISAANFSLSFVTKQRFGAISRYVRSRPLSYFAKVLNGGRRRSAATPTTTSTTPTTSSTTPTTSSTTQNDETTPTTSSTTPTTSSTTQNDEPYDIEGTQESVDLTLSSPLPPLPSQEDMRMELLRVTRNAYIAKKLIREVDSLDVTVTYSEHTYSGKITCPVQSCNTTLSPFFGFYKKKYRWSPSTVTRHIERKH